MIWSEGMDNERMIVRRAQIVNFTMDLDERRSSEWSNKHSLIGDVN